MLNALVRIASRQGGTQILFDVVRAPNTHTHTQTRDTTKQHTANTTALSRAWTASHHPKTTTISNVYASLACVVCWLFAAQTVYTMGIF